MSDDKRSAKILKLEIEYQVVKQCKTGFIVSRDALKAYGINIEESTISLHVSIGDSSPDFRIPITEGARYGAVCHRRFGGPG